MSNLPLHEQFKRLRLSGLLESFDVRLDQARQEGLSHTEWLSMLLQDEIQRRDNQSLLERLTKAKFEQTKTFEGFDMQRYPLKIQHLIRDLMTGLYLEQQRHVLIVGPTGTGKTHLAQALGHQACRQGKKVRFIRGATLLREMHASRADQTWDKVLKRFMAPDLLIIDDFGLAALTFAQAEDIYELIAERHLTSSFLFTSKRKLEAWLQLFPDPAMGNAALDRIISQGYAVVLEGESYRQQKPPTMMQIKEENMITPAP